MTDSIVEKTVFYVSDSTGITAETLGNSLITQFENIKFIEKTFPYIDNEEKALGVLAKIEQAYQKEQNRPLIFATLINSKVRSIISEAPGLYFDFFKSYLKPMEKELQKESSYTVGRSHGVHDIQAYNTRINAINYTLMTDDGTKMNQYEQADIIIIGVSRCGKTPTCLYLALQFGIHAANYPLVEEDLTSIELPECLKPFKKKLFGLTIDSYRLQAIRNERRPDSQYSNLKQCVNEIRHVEALFANYQIPFVSASTLSIEEISTKILATSGLRRHLA